GARMHANYFRVGGVHQDLPAKLLDDIEAFCDPFLQVCDDLEGLLTENRIFKQRNVGIAEVKLADAWAWGFAGVMVRGSGAAWDLRKAQPYECYSELDFDIPIGKNGDGYDRDLVRRNWRTMPTASSARFGSAISGNRWLLFRKSASSPRPKDGR